MPSSLHPMGLAAHVADLHAALFDTQRNDPREALRLLRGDPVAQIMSFLSCQEERRCLSAVSPQMRLDSEVMADELRILRVDPRAQIGAFSLNSTCAVENNEPFFRFDADSQESNRQQMLNSLWWASRCGLPMQVSIDNHNREMLARLGDALRSRVRALTVTMRSPPASASSATVLASLLSFPNLQSLSIRNDEKQADTPVPTELLSALETAANLPLTSLSVVGCGALHDLRTMAGSRFLRSLIVRNCGLLSLEGLGSFHMLETMAVLSCPHLTSISAIAGLSRLQKVFIAGCNLQSLDGLDRCAALKSVNVRGNRNLQSLSPLAGAPLLETIVAYDCDIHSVQGLGSCAALTEITLDFSGNLQSLGDLSKAPRLQKVKASWCELRDLGETGPWLALREIDVRNNRDLQSLSGLAGAKLLEKVHAVGCSIQDFTVLETCPMLRKNC